MMNKDIQQKTLMIDSDNGDSFNYRFIIENDSSYLVKIEGNKEIEISFDIEIRNDCHFTCLIINDNKEKVKLNDSYSLAKNCQVQVAYSLLNDKSIELGSAFDLSGQGSELHVLTASVSSVKKRINQICNHYANNTIANIDNYGVVFENGDCQLIVKNSINKGFKNCQTHQTSRLLTFGENAIGKILPILYIDDNEVAASHACTIGQPDEQQLYYLQSRGLTRKQAIQLITVGYLMPITKVIENEKINNLLKEEIETRVMD